MKKLLLFIPVVLLLMIIPVYGHDNDIGWSWDGWCATLADIEEPQNSNDWICSYDIAQMSNDIFINTQVITNQTKIIMDLEERIIDLEDRIGS